MQKFIRNFVIIAHIDHGKTTLSDRFIEQCSDYSFRKNNTQVLDTMDIEKERGITIKAQCVRLSYKAKDGNNYILNLMDTPGHADFFYEVSRSFEASDGAVLLVDATQGVQAQTVSNCVTAIEYNNVVIPVLNKIDLVTSDIIGVSNDICSIFNFKKQSILTVSGKTGLGITDLLESIVCRVPQPKGCVTKPLQCVILDSWFDKYLGVVSIICVKNGVICVKDKIRVISTGKIYVVEKLGFNTPNKVFVDKLSVGEIGFIIAGVREITDMFVGDTITFVDSLDVKPLPSFKKIQPKVFAGFYPIDSTFFEHLKKSLCKLKLNDFSLFFEVENSPTLGFGFRCGFLGTLHLEIIKERLEREFDIDIFVTAPNVTYRLLTKCDTNFLFIDNPNKLSTKIQIAEVHEPVVLAKIFAPKEFLGKIINLVIENRGIQREVEYFNKNLLFTFEIPLSEIIASFFDDLKTVTNGYASFNYNFLDYRKDDLVRLDILLNGVLFDGFSSFVHKTVVYNKGRTFVKKLWELIPRQLYDVSIQAAVGSKIISRETVKSLRKDVISKCYGGDVTRKRKLLEKQKKGKKKMKVFGKINLPKEIFLKMLGK